ncbi:MAG: WS/DGAT domain-containing protein [Chloroflexota bacterium]
MAGARIDEIMAWVPQAGRLGLGVSIFSYAGQVFLA